MDLAVGTLYGGSSITKGRSSSLKNLLRIFAPRTAIKIPNAYNPSITRPAFLGKKAPAIRMYTGIRPAHDIIGMIRVVIRRLFGLSIVRVANIAGTLQPNPMIIGMKDLPCSPILCISLSMMNAARAIYPESSNNDMKK